MCKHYNILPKAQILPQNCLGFYIISMNGIFYNFSKRSIKAPWRCCGGTETCRSVHNIILYCNIYIYILQYTIIHLLTYLLTPCSTVLLEKLTGLQLVKKFPSFLWNPKVHYRTHKLPPPVPVLGQPNPVHIPTSHLLEIHPNIIHPSTHRFSQWSLSLRFPHQDPIRPPLLTYTCHMSSPSHSTRFKVIHYIILFYYIILFIIYLNIYAFVGKNNTQ